jgi:hypothetical protein
MIHRPIDRSNKNNRSDTINLLHLPAPNWRVRAVRAVYFCAWTLNFALLVATFVWIVHDGRSQRIIQSLERWLGLGESLSSTGPIYTTIPVAVQGVGLGLAVAACSLAVMFFSLIVGASHFRTTRWWLLFVGAVCGWLGLFTTWPEIYWRGQQHRIHASLDSAADILQIVTTNWPASDGEIAGVGAFLAYPTEAPTTLLMLGEGVSPQAAIHFSAIERTADGTIRFELAGRETGAWLEWRPDELPPGSFVGGLQTNYTIERSTQLTPHWYLVRYRASAANLKQAESDSRTG